MRCVGADSLAQPFKAIAHIKAVISAGADARFLLCIHACIDRGSDRGKEES